MKVHNATYSLSSSDVTDLRKCAFLEIRNNVGAHLCLNCFIKADELMIST